MDIGVGAQGLASRAPVTFLLLGPVELLVDGRLVPLGRRQERLLLALLLLEANRSVPTKRLVDLLWPSVLPDQPNRTLQVYASRLRKALAGAFVDPPRLLGGRDHFRLVVEPETCDWYRFGRMVAAARRIGSPSARAEALRAALQLWRGPALSDVATEDLRNRLCSGIQESYHTAVELRVEADLAAGRHPELLPELAELTGRYPMREPLVAARMLALYRSGRRAEALQVYHDLAARLADELGVDPSPILQERYLATLRADPSLALTGH